MIRVNGEVAFYMGAVIRTTYCFPDGYKELGLTGRQTQMSSSSYAQRTLKVDVT